MLNRAAEEIKRARKSLADIPEDEDLVPAGRWILDNFFMVEQEIFRVQNMLRSGPPHLPIMNNEGIPRVCLDFRQPFKLYERRLDTETLVVYLNEYQKKSPLMLKELWILPAFLRLAVLKRIAEVASACTDTQQQWDAAESFAEYMAATPGDEQAWLARGRKIPWFRRDNTGGAFLERLSVRLMEQGESAAAQLKWLDELLSERGYILDDLIASSHHRQGAEKLLISNCMDSLRYLDALNWLDLFRLVSVVERTLMEDPPGVYRRMDELSRGMYRRRVERLAERWRVSELHLTRLAVQCAAEHAEQRLREGAAYRLLHHRRRQRFPRGKGEGPQVPPRQEDEAAALQRLDLGRQRGACAWFRPAAALRRSRQDIRVPGRARGVHKDRRVRRGRDRQAHRALRGHARHRPEGRHTGRGQDARDDPGAALRGRTGFKS